MSVIDNYFNHYFKDMVDENHKLDIINIYNNIQTYDYCDLFDTDMSFNTIRTTFNRKIFTLLKPKKYHLVKATVFSSDKTKIYKMYIFQNDKCKDYFIINALREFYFQAKFRETLINNNIQNVIVPEIYRYGIINIETNNEIICFAEMQYYHDTSIDELNNLLEQAHSYRTKLEKTYLYLKNLYSTINTITELEKQIQIYHNDIGDGIRPIQDVLNSIESIVNPQNNHNDNICRNYLAELNLHVDNISMVNICNRLHITDNLFLSNYKYILIDFEHTSTSNSSIWFGNDYKQIMLLNMIGKYAN